MWIDSFVVTDAEQELLGTYDLCRDSGLDTRLVMYMDIDGDHVNIQMKAIPSVAPWNLSEEQLVQLYDKWEADLAEGRRLSTRILRNSVGMFE